MRRWLVAAALLACADWPSAASAEQFAGALLADVRVESGGQPLADPAVLALVETRVGEPLTMTDIRDTIEHLVGLGRFHDVRVFADPGPEAGSVSLRWVLTPVQRITRIEVAGPAEFSSATIRTVIAEEMTGALAAARQAEVIGVVRAYYTERGYRAATVTARLEPGERPDVVTLVLDIAAGPPTTIGAVVVEGAPPAGAAAVIERLGLRRGRAYDREALADRLASYEESLREDGHYMATVRESAALSPDEATAAVRVVVQPGPRVRLVFAGDPLPSGDRDRLVPIRSERSIDQDLLEDAGRNIENHLRQQGYRDARASFARETEGSELVLTFTIGRGPLHRIGTMRLTGTAALGKTELDPLLKLATGDPFVESQVATVAAVVLERYRVAGFAQVRLTPLIEVLPSETRSGVAYRPVNIRFDIVEGPRTVVGTVTLAGRSALPEDRLRGLLSLVPGRPFYRPLLNSDRDGLVRLYRNEGYLSAAVGSETSPSDDNQVMNLTWAIREGPLTLVDHILISGNVHTSSELIRRELTLKPGAPLGADAILESQQRLSALGLFRRVRIQELPRPGSASRDVLVDVEEAPSTSVSEGGGIDVGRRPRASETGGAAEDRIEVAPSGFFNITRRNLWGKNRSISFFARVALRPRDPPADNTDPTDTGGYGLNEYRVLGSYREPRVFGTPGDGQLTAFVDQGVRASFNFNRQGLRADYARLLQPRVTATLRYTLERTERFDEQIAPEDQLPIDRLFPQVRLSSIFSGVLRDSRDDVLDPTRGTVVGLDGSVAARSLGSEVGFVKSFLQGFYYRRLPGRGYVVAVGGRIGLATGFPRDVPRLDDDGNPVLGPDGQPIVDSVKDLPASERFFAGGDTTVRGFALDRLGTNETLDESGFPQGGNGLAVFNLELRAPYWKGLSLVGFVDTGNVFKNAGDMALGELRVASGVGVRYRSPIGPLRVDFGFKLHPLVLEGGGREKRFEYHISLGQAF